MSSPENLSSLLNSLEKRLKDVNEHLTENSRSINEKLPNLINGVKYIIEETDKINNDITALNRNITGVKADISTRQATKDELEKSIKTLEIELAEKNDEYTRVENNCREISNQNDSLDREMVHLKGEIEKIEKHKEEAKSQLDGIKPQFESKKEEYNIKIRDNQELKNKFLSRYKALRYLNSKEYLRGKVPEIHVLDLMISQKDISLDVIAASTGRPIGFIKEVADNLVKRDVIKIQDGKIALLKDFKLKEE